MGEGEIHSQNLSRTKTRIFDRQAKRKKEVQEVLGGFGVFHDQHLQFQGGYESPRNHCAPVLWCESR